MARLDAVVISHADVDHAGGVDAVKRTLPVLATYGPGDCAALSWRWGEVSFELGTGRGPSRNDRSCVLLVDTGLQRVLLPSDIERDAELDLLQRVDVSADVLLAPITAAGRVPLFLSSIGCSLVWPSSRPVIAIDLGIRIPQCSPDMLGAARLSSRRLNRARYGFF